MIAISCKCGRTYRLDDKYAGRSVQCRQCGEVLSIPKPQSLGTEGEAERATPVPATSLDQKREADRQDGLRAQDRGKNIAKQRPSDQYETSCRYRVVQALAQGGMGRISIACDVALKRNVAVKELLDGIDDLSGSRRRLIAEAEITGQLDHPGVVPIYAMGTDGEGKPFYTMRLIEGRTLTQAIDSYHKSQQLVDLRELLRRFLMVCQTVAYAHERGVIHRDLKPANIMLGRFGETLVMDWGLAKPVRDGQGDDSTLGNLAEHLLAERADLTAADGVVGTPCYMPPEQALGKTAQVGAAADIYSLGSVLYHLLSGKPPYTGKSSLDIIKQVAAAGPPKPSVVCRRVPRALEAICLKAMAREPRNRYGSAAELAENVQHWLDDEPVGGYAEPRLERIYRWSRRHKAAVVSSAICLILTVLVGSAATVIYQRERDKARALERIADDYRRQAAEAQQQADDKEAEADRLAKDAEASRREAADAMRQAAQSRQASDQAAERVAALEAELAAKTGETEEISKKAEAARAEVAAAEARVKAESERADAAAERAAAAERQVVALRREADEYRAVALKLTQSVVELANPRQAAAIQPNTPWEDFTQRAAASFDVVADDKADGTAASDTGRVRTGRQSFRASASNGGLCVTYPKSRDANWDLSKYDYLTFAFSLEGAGAAHQDDGLVVRIGRGSQCIEYHASPESRWLAPQGWAVVKIPLWGNTAWTRREINALDLSRVDWIEINVSTHGHGVTLWLDDLRFGADVRHKDRELLPDPDRAAAEYIVSTNGEADAWVSGQAVTIRAMPDVPKDLFKVFGVRYRWDRQNDVTDATLKLIGTLTDCQSLVIPLTSVTDGGLEYLKDMDALSEAVLPFSRIHGEGLKHLSSLPNLRSLDVGGSLGLSDEAMTHVASMAKLTDLGIAETNVTNEGLKRISGHPALRAIFLNGTRITEDGLRNLRALPAGLNRLVLDTDNAPKGIAVLEGAPLRAIDIRVREPNKPVDTAVFDSLLRFPDLADVSLSGSAIDANVIQRLCRLENLKTLLLGLYNYNPPISSHALRELAGAPKLESLAIRSGVAVSGASLNELATLTRLKSIDLQECLVEPADVLELKRKLPDCTITAGPEIQKLLDEARPAR